MDGETRATIAAGAAAATGAAGPTASGQTASGPATSGPTWRRIAEELIEAIGRGEYATGTVLPTALALAETYGVHRHTVRQAFRHLQDLGLVSVEQGRGTFVTGPRIAYPLGRRVRLRENLRASGITLQVQVVMHDVIRADQALASLLGVNRGATIARARTLTLANGAPMATTMLRLSAERFPDFVPVLIESQSKSITEAWRKVGVPDYLRAWTKMTSRLPGQEEMNLLGIGPGTPVMQASALDVDLEGHPIAAVESVFIGDRVELVVEP